MRKRRRRRLIPKKPLTKRERRINGLAQAISLIFGIIAMLSCVEIGEMDNNLSGVTFFFLFFAVGLIITILAGRLIEKKLPDYLKSDKKTYTVVQSNILIFSLILTALANYYNRTFPLTKPEYKTYQILEKSKSRNRSSSTYTYYLYVDINDDKERLYTNKETWNKVSEYGQVKLGITTGGLGFKYVSEIWAN